MKVHHLNCGTMNAPGAAIVCHVLLVETANGLVLVDSGFGLNDCADPTRIGPSRHLLRPTFDVDETAARQVEKLGFRRDDVRHITSSRRTSTSTTSADSVTSQTRRFTSPRPRCLAR